MRRTIGVTTSEHVVVGVVENNRLLGSLRVYPEDDSTEDLLGMPAEAIAHRIRLEIEAVSNGQSIEAIGVGIPGIIRGPIIEESPNLQQLKGCNMGDTLSAELRDAGINAPVFFYNDADIVATGLAATRGQLDRL